MKMKKYLEMGKEMKNKDTRSLLERKYNDSYDYLTSDEVIKLIEILIKERNAWKDTAFTLEKERLKNEHNTTT